MAALFSFCLWSFVLELDEIACTSSSRLGAVFALVSFVITLYECANKIVSLQIHFVATDLHCSALDEDPDVRREGTERWTLWNLVASFPTKNGFAMTSVQNS
jgi:hypothetical protein